MSVFRIVLVSYPFNFFTSGWGYSTFGCERLVGSVVMKERSIISICVIKKKWHCILKFSRSGAKLNYRSFAFSLQRTCFLTSLCSGRFSVRDSILWENREERAKLLWQYDKNKKMGLCKLRMSWKRVSENWERLNLHSRPQSLRARRLCRLKKDRSNREKWSRGGSVFSFFYIFTFLFLSLKIFSLDRADLFSFRPKSPEILFEWIGPSISFGSLGWRNGGL